MRLRLPILVAATVCAANCNLVIDPNKIEMREDAAAVLADAGWVDGGGFDAALYLEGGRGGHLV